MSRNLLPLFIVLSFLATVFGLPTSKNIEGIIYPENRSPKVRVTNGQDAQPGAYPYQVAFYINRGVDGYSFCGGSLISKNYILTAAHCVDGNAEFVEIFLGHNEIKGPGDSSAIVSKELIIHEGWTGQYKDDIALIKLPEPVDETDLIKIITLDKSNSTHVGETGVASGWGKTEYSFSIVTKLKYVESNVITNEDCQAAHPALKATVQETHVCTSGKDGKGTCSGDSGGPLVINNVQVGVVSFGLNDCVNSPSVFTRVTDYVDWITQKCLGCQVEEQDSGVVTNPETPDKKDDSDNGGVRISIGLFCYLIVAIYLLF